MVIHSKINILHLDITFCKNHIHIIYACWYTVCMIDLSAAGLSNNEAKCYTELLKKTAWRPSDLAAAIGETRTNCYKILDRLVGYGLAERFDQDKKLHYRATNPSRLLQLVREQRAVREKAEQELELHAQNLMGEYLKTNEQAGVRYFQGKEEIKEIFEEIAASSGEVTFVHTPLGIDFYGFETMHNLRMLAINAGVPRRALTPDNRYVKANSYQENDVQSLLDRTWLRAEDYTASVEWGAFDGKLYIINYAQEALGLIIDSPAIAEAFKQLFTLMERGQKLQPWYNTLPTLAQRADEKT